MKLRELTAVMAAVVLVAGCTKAQKADTPERALEKYVSIAFNAKGPDDLQKMKELSAGDALAFLEEMDEASFKKHFVDANLDMVGMKTKDLRHDVTGDASLVYELSFKEGKDPAKTIHTNKKIAYLTLDKTSGEWKIKATKNMKSFVERKEDLVVPPNTPETTTQESEPAAK